MGAILVLRAGLPSSGLRISILYHFKSSGVSHFLVSDYCVLECKVIIGNSCRRRICDTHVKDVTCV